jgi:hypothetical protein
MRWPREIGLDVSIAVLAAYRQPQAYWDSKVGLSALRQQLGSPKPEEIGRGLLTCAGLLRVAAGDQLRALAKKLPWSMVTPHIFQDDPALCSAAALAWGWIYERQGLVSHDPSPVLDRLLYLYLADSHPALKGNVQFALISQLGLPRGAWRAALNEAQAQRIREAVERAVTNPSLVTSLFIALHAENVYRDDELAKRIAVVVSTKQPHWLRRYRLALEQMLSQMGEIGRKYLDEPH